MGYGSHTGGAWYLIVLPAAFFILRFVILPRRRGMGRRAPGGDQPTSASVAPNTTNGAPSPGFGRSGIPAGWMVDPSGRYDRRYWSGTEWTEHVTKDGAPGTDPPPVISSSGG